MQAATALDDSLFVEYWGESVPKGRPRLVRWLEKADEIAHGWTPSKVLFVE